MKNKIYDAFDSIKLDNGVKKRAYQIALENRVKKTNKYIYSVLCFGLTVCFVFFILPKEESLPTDDSMIETYGVKSTEQDMILYNGNTYFIDNEMNLDSIKIDKKIGELSQVEQKNSLRNNFDSYYHDGYEVYTSSIKDILIVKSNEETIIYKIQ